ncbi:MAG TPA: DUF1697 domain-containing protein [Thermoanaerobaculaceae bacterium]|nr:DUF1697 domain-containing protein [Thermoanaerobaculaceae bacterium]HPS79946.1 DUF1697 domain-containing protein [Thermoanaerobaculaceae bacterium]
MSTFVALLRGINVSGHRPVNMRRLSAAFACLGLADVVTYLQSGNVVFDVAPGDVTELRRRLEAAIDATFGFPVTVLLRTSLQMDRVVKACPFAAAAAHNPTRVAVAFLADEPSPEALGRLTARTHEPDEILVEGSEAYIHCPDGFGRTKLSNAYLEKTLGTASTARNWNTVNHLMALAVHRQG